MSPVGAYVGRRLALLLPVLFGASLVVFLLTHLIPGDPAVALLGPEATPEVRDAFRHTYGLDQPLPAQYAKWLWQTVHLDLGMSIARSQPVTALLGLAFKNTVLLAFAAALIGNTAGLLLGIVAALRQSGTADRLTMALAALSTAVPGFWLGTVLVAGLAVAIPLFPTQGMQSATGGGTLDLLRHLALPAIAASAGPAGIVARTTRSSLLEVLSLDFVQALRARGLSGAAILWQHVLPNAFPPIFTIMGLQAGHLLGGVAFVEVIFSWPGVGNLVFVSIGYRDFPVILGVVLMAAAVFVLINLTVDVIHAALDPRVRAATVQ
jgi:peptide/nickel transport system permease protein